MNKDSEMAKAINSPTASHGLFVSYLDSKFPCTSYLPAGSGEALLTEALELEPLFSEMGVYNFCEAG